MVFRIVDEVRPADYPGVGTVECAHMDGSPAGLCVTHVLGSTAQPSGTVDAVQCPRTAAPPLGAGVSRAAWAGRGGAEDGRCLLSSPVLSAFPKYTHLALVVGEKPFHPWKGNLQAGAERDGKPVYCREKMVKLCCIKNRSGGVDNCLFFSLKVTICVHSCTSSARFSLNVWSSTGQGQDITFG